MSFLSGLRSFFRGVGRVGRGIVGGIRRGVGVVGNVLRGVRRGVDVARSLPIVGDLTDVALNTTPAGIAFQTGLGVAERTARRVGQVSDALSGEGSNIDRLRSGLQQVQNIRGEIQQPRRTAMFRNELLARTRRV